MLTLRIEAHIERMEQFFKNRSTVRSIGKINGDDHDIRVLLLALPDPFASKLNDNTGMTLKADIFEKIYVVEGSDPKNGALINGSILPAHFEDQINELKENLKTLAAKYPIKEISLFLEKREA